MIVLFTDFSFNGPYVGQLKSRIVQIDQHIHIIDLMHDAPAFDIKYSALLLDSLVEKMPVECVFCCVVDPGVGGSREAIVIKVNHHYFVGPNNGLFEYILRSNQSIEVFLINYQPTNLSNTFHGRDVFAPIAALIHSDKFDYLEEINLNSLQRFNWQNNLLEIIYIDPFGNLMTGIHADFISKKTILEYKGDYIHFRRTYSTMDDARLYWYVNSNDLVEIGLNTQNAAKLLNSKIGDSVTILIKTE